MRIFNRTGRKIFIKSGMDERQEAWSARNFSIERR